MGGLGKEGCDRDIWGKMEWGIGVLYECESIQFFAGNNIYEVIENG